MVNARHLFYGPPCWTTIRLAATYLIFGMCDRFSINVTRPIDLDHSWENYFHVTWLNQFYWVWPSRALPINVKGMDFVLNALFIVLIERGVPTANTPLPLWLGSSFLCLVFSDRKTMSGHDPP